MDSLKNVLDTILDFWPIKFVVAVLLSVDKFCFAPYHDKVTIVVAFIALDTLTGVLKAYKQHNLSSSGFFRFAIKLLVYFVLLATGSLLDKAVPVTDYISAFSVLVAFLALTESLSVLENISDLGYSVPTRIISALKLAKDQLDNKTSSTKEKKL